MIKSVIAGAVAMAVVSFGVNAAPTTPQGQGRVTFNGTEPPRESWRLNFLRKR